jgi:cytochrome b subunit of formate dehydrogenase
MGYNTKSKYGFWAFVLDLFLIVITGGIWLIWMIFRALRSN